jgi:hypothetical protein
MQDTDMQIKCTSIQRHLKPACHKNNKNDQESNGQATKRTVHCSYTSTSNTEDDCKAREQPSENEPLEIVCIPPSASMGRLEPQILKNKASKGFRGFASNISLLRNDKQMMARKEQNRIQGNTSNIRLAKTKERLVEIKHMKQLYKNK